MAQDTPASVTITPAGPEFLPVGKTRQLTAQVNYTLGSAGNQNVVWSSSDPQVATVDRNGKVTAVAEGTATILAVSEAKDALGSVVTGEYALTVTPARLLPDRLVLSAQQKRVEAGQGVDIVLTAPSALLHNGEADVTDDYTLTYQWTDAQGSPVGTDPTLQVTPTADTTYTCTVTAACTLDSTQVLTGQCVYTLRMHPGHHPRGGDRPGPGHPHPWTS